MISVIIPARNASTTISKTLSSLVADRAIIHEILLVDDGSEDETVEVARKAAEGAALPLVVKHVGFGNAGATRNAGLSGASADRIFFLDADDEVMPGGITLLNDALDRTPGAGLAVGGSIHRGSKADKLKLPGIYGTDRAGNARRYLANELRSITVGSALVEAGVTQDIRFPESISLDEDTIYWAAVLSRCSVVTVAQPVLVYNLDETRMARRFVSNPRKVFFDIAREIDRLGAFGIGQHNLRRRKAFIALRIARHLIRRQRYAEAADMIEVALSNGADVQTAFKAMQYRVRVWAGMARRLQEGSADKSRGSPFASSRIMVLTVDPACPPVSGGDLRNWQNAVAASGLGEVCLVSIHPLAGPASSGNQIRLEALSRPDDEPGHAVRHRRTSVEARISQTMLSRLKEIIEDFHPDTVIVEGIPLFALIPHLRLLVPRLVLDMHNVESDLVDRISVRSGIGTAWLNKRGVQVIERRAAEMVDQIWVCSEVDRERARHLIGTSVPIHVVPNGIPRFETVPTSLPSQPGKAKGWPVILFAGHLGYPPNVAAARRLALQILPLVKKAFPLARLVLAGRSPDPAVVSLGNEPGVDILPDPADMHSVLGAAHVSVMPLDAGGGTRIKIPEAMAWGVPVVATALAAEGHDFIDGVDILIAETDEALAASVVSLCREPERLSRQRARAFEKVMRVYGPDVIQAAVRAGLDGTVCVCAA
ncbi:MAG: glycosyltransferase [Rhizobiaceae bacterium]|nr:glycosyltransferase [Rhizobiaceae bacterium]